MDSEVELLIKQVESLEDYEQASQALMEIVHKEPVVGLCLALNILIFNKGDVHLRAFAFSMLYRVNKSAAFHYIQEKAKTCEPKVFLAMLGEVTEDAGLLNDSLELREMIAFIREAILYRRDYDTEELRRGVRDFMIAYDLKA